ncbi:opioid growth factor receptor-like isoform X1 [Ictalurus furcatus]|uniref:opioid growth factor receptor-like isoform X1 n=1 Tax=Ictalurus furcatus TaxID=66913 RepID=UPI0023505639|nr:opioid growth factor receptor-like isoform X1 [Ictalurus furcatus]
MDRSWRSLRQDQVMGNTPNFSKDYDEQYDSTWEDESDGEESRESSMQWSHRNTHAAKDMQTFRHKFRKTQHDDSTDDYLEDDEELPNLRFYQNDMPFYPDGVLIEDFHCNWFGDYGRLEYVHSYIQWLFPIQEKGMNYASRELSLKEIKLFRTDEEVQRRLLTSYKLMLDLYGIELVSEDSGEVKRAENWKERFANLNRNTQNNLRITHILKCLGLLGFRHYQKPLVHFFLEETLVNDQLPRVKHSVLDYFMFAVLDKDERKDLIKFAYCNFKPKEDFVWCPRRIRNKLEKETVSHKLNAGSNEGESSDSTSQSDQNDLLNSRVHKKNEIKTDTNEDTGNNKSLRCESRNDQNVSGESQDSEEQASQHTERDSKENDSKEIQKSDSESSEDSMATGTATNTEANSAHYDAEKSADQNSYKYTFSPGEANASS